MPAAEAARCLLPVLAVQVVVVKVLLIVLQLIVELLILAAEGAEVQIHKQLVRVVPG